MKFYTLYNLSNSIWSPVTMPDWAWMDRHPSYVLGAIPQKALAVLGSYHGDTSSAGTTKGGNTVAG
jgi:hypothetical protein